MLPLADWLPEVDEAVPAASVFPTPRREDACDRSHFLKVFVRAHARESSGDSVAGAPATPCCAAASTAARSSAAQPACFTSAANRGADAVLCLAFFCSSRGSGERSCSHASAISPAPEKVTALRRAEDAVADVGEVTVVSLDAPASSEPNGPLEGASKSLQYASRFLTPRWIPPSNDAVTDAT